MHLEPIRILISDVPAMLRDIIEDFLAAHDDITLVGRPGLDGDIVDAVRRTRADVLIRGDGHEDPEVEAALAAHPRLKVLSVESDGRRAYLSELHRRVWPLGELSPQALLESIRAAYVAET